MEIPDVIAVNKLDHPRRRRRCSTRRAPGARARRRRATGGRRSSSRRRCAARGSRSCGQRSRRTGATSRPRASSRRAAARNLAAEVFAVASARARRHLEHAVADDPELRRLLERGAAPRARPAHRGARDPARRCSTLASDARHPTDRLTSRPRASGSAAARASHAGLRLRDALRELAAAASLLKAENLQRTGSFKIRGAFNKLATLSAEERAAGVVAASAGNHGQAVAWAAREARHPRDDLHAAGRADGEGRADPRATARRPCSAATASTRRSPRPSQRVERDRRDLRARVRGRARDRAARGRSGSSSPSRCPSVETVLIPIGGGGLAAGIAIALRALRPERAARRRRGAARPATRSPTGSPSSSRAS